MEITSEEIKGLNVRTDVDLLVQTAEKAHEATIEIPYIQKEIYSICLNKFKWALFYEALNPDSHNIGWYHKYKELSEKKLIELTQKRGSSEMNWYKPLI